MDNIKKALHFINERAKYPKKQDSVAHLIKVVPLSELNEIMKLAINNEIDSFLLDPLMSMNICKFEKQWKDCMVYKPDLFDLDMHLCSVYEEYKSELITNGKLSVSDFCKIKYANCHMEESPLYMVKEFAMQTKHANGLIKLANKFRKSNGMDEIPLID